MKIQKTGALLVAMICVIVTFMSVQAQKIDPAMLQRAKAMGISQSDIESAMSGKMPTSVSGTGQSMNKDSREKMSFLRDSLIRKPFSQEDLDQINPTQLERIISNSIDQQGTAIDIRSGAKGIKGAATSTNSLTNLLDPKTGTAFRGAIDANGREVDPTQLDYEIQPPVEYEIVIKDGKYIKRTLPTVFGREVFSNKNLTFAPNYNMATPKNYLLGAGDEVIVEVWGGSELYIKEKLTPEGMISITGLGPVNLAGLTIEEADRRIRSKVSQIMDGAQSKVSLGHIRSIKVNIAGEVVVPGTYTLPSLASAFNAIYSAGGVNKIGSLRSIKVYRNSKQIADLDIYDYLINGKYDTNIRLEDNDMIIVSPYESYVAVTGKVKRERVYEMKKGETLGQLFRYSGGLRGDAYSESINVKRKSGRQYEIFTVDAPDFEVFTLNDGDSVVVDKIINEYANRVSIDGAVWRPGSYQLSDKIPTLSALITKAEGLKGNEFASRGQITRRKSDYTKEVIPFNVREVASGVNDIVLMQEDSIYIPNILELREDFHVGIYGEVNNPDMEMPFKEGMTVEDVILLSGGLKESASLAKIEVARRIKDPNSTSYNPKTANLFTFNIDNNLSIAPEASRFVLRPFDEVYVRRSPGYSEQQRVVLGGELLYPGSYVLASAGERISDVVAKSGGFTPEAYVRGASVKRKMTDDEKVRVESMLRMMEAQNGSGDKSNYKSKDSIAMDKIDFNALYPIGVDVVAAMANPGGIDDIILRDGDQLFVPKMNSTVKISGQVNYPNSVTFSNKRVKDYISQAGGYKYDARRRPFVIYMNGRVSATRSGFFARRYPKVEPGCEVVVPIKQTRQGNGLANVMGMMSSTASMAAMIASVINLSK